MQCRICLDTDRPDEMLTPCACRGSAMYIHRQCLEEYIQYYPNRKCTVCQTPFEYRPSHEKLIIACFFVFLFLALYSTSVSFLVKFYLFTMVTSILAVTVYYDCLNADITMTALATCVVCSVAPTHQTLIGACIFFTLIATLHTVSRFVPIKYICFILGILAIAVYVMLFMVSLIGLLDAPATAIVFTSMYLTWLLWVRTHPPLRQVED